MKQAELFIMDNFGTESPITITQEELEELLVKYASQAVDECAEMAEVKYIDDSDGWPMKVVNKHSILSVKSKLR